MIDLKPKQLKLLEMMLIEPVFEEAYKKANLSKNTALKYKNAPEFKKAYRQAKRDSMENVTTQLQRSAIEAVQVLKEIMNDEETPPTARIQAARTVLDNAYKGIELEDISERLENVEAFMEGQNN
ncbi:replication protein [Vagococcus fluvialis]|uniref:replication protein n=1 Tax=Vagococcus fluvialis TaxID=2738 RepID=UPI0037941D8F